MNEKNAQPESIEEYARKHTPVGVASIAILIAEIMSRPQCQVGRIADLIEALQLFDQTATVNGIEALVITEPNGKKYKVGEIPLR